MGWMGLFNPSGGIIPFYDAELYKDNISNYDLIRDHNADEVVLERKGLLDAILTKCSLSVRTKLNIKPYLYFL